MFPDTHPGRCAACGLALDQLRAPALRMTTRGAVFFCCSEHADGYDLSEAPPPVSRADLLPPEPDRGLPRSVEQAYAAAPSKAPFLASPSSGVAASRGLLGPHPKAELAPRRHRRWLSLRWLPVLAMMPVVALSVASESRRSDGSFLLLLAVAAWALLGLRLAAWVGGPSELLLMALGARLRGTATRVVGGRFEDVPAHSVRAGEEVEVVAGAVLLVDGVVVSGEGEVRKFAGSPDALTAGPGVRLCAGAQILTGSLRVVCTGADTERTWGRLASRGQERESGLARAADTLEQRVGPALAAVSALAFGWLGGSWLDGLALGVANLAALASPLSGDLQAALHRKWLLSLANVGVHVGPGALDAAAQVTMCVLCTRGTVLAGEPEVAEIHAFRGADEQEVLALAAGAESVVEHPTAFSILRAAHERGVGPDPSRGHHLAPGMGVLCFSSGGAGVVVGTRELLLRERVSIAMAEELLRKLENRGRVGILVAKDGHLVGVLALHDGLRVGARAAVQQLLDGRVEPVLLSGDTRLATEALGRALSIEHVRPEVPARERGEEVRRLVGSGAVVAVMGHSPLDDSALAGGQVPIVLDAAAQSMKTSGICVLPGEVLLGTHALLVLQELRREGLIAWTLGFLPAIVGALGASSLIFPPVLAPALAMLGGLGGALWVWLRRDRVVPGRLSRVSTGRRPFV